MTALHHFRIAALLEGWSYLILLFIAMPLKYAVGIPLAVRIVGSVHGFLYSLTPFVAFVFDRSLVREMARTRIALGRGAVQSATVDANGSSRTKQ